MFLNFSKHKLRNVHPADLVTFAEETINGKLRFLCSGCTLKFFIFLSKILRC